jgi:uncharacterized protein YndB with AHSA1/START domain
MHTITVIVEVKASLAHVWEKWTEPQHVMHWNFASVDWHCPDAENDLRVGGKFTYTMAARDGQMSFPFSGVYTEIADQQRIAYVMADGRKVLVEFKQTHDGVVVTETFDPENENPVDMQQAGWQAILNQFKQYAEQ